MLPDRSRQPAVRGHERGIVRLRERDIHRVKGAEVVAQIQNAAEERLVTLALEREVEVGAQSLAGALERDALLEHETPERGHDLHVAKGWSVQILRLSFDDGPDRV